MFTLRSGAVGALMCAFQLTVVHAGDVALHVKTGLWQSTVAMQTSGQLPIAEADLDKIPPEKRQQIEAAMQAAIASAAQPHVVTSCVTDEQLRKGLSFKTEDGP